MLSDFLQQDGIVAYQATGDADTLIVSVALDNASSRDNVTFETRDFRTAGKYSNMKLDRQLTTNHRTTSIYQSPLTLIILACKSRDVDASSVCQIVARVTASVMQHPRVLHVRNAASP